MVYTLYHSNNPAFSASINAIHEACHEMGNKGILHIMREQSDGTLEPQTYPCRGDKNYDNQRTVHFYHQEFDRSYNRSPTRRRRNSPIRSVRRSARTRPRRFSNGRKSRKHR